MIFANSTPLAVSQLWKNKHSEVVKLLSVGPVSQAPAAGSLLGQLPAKSLLIVAQLPASCRQAAD